MAQSLPHRLSLALVAGAAAAALAAAPALASEPTIPPPSDPLPTGIAPVTFAPPQSTTAPAGKVIRKARLKPRRVARGKRALLRLSLTTPSKLRIVISRGRHGGRGQAAALNVPAGGKRVSVRLPARSKGHTLRAGRYRVSIVVIDAQGKSSAPVNRTLIVLRAARR